MARYTGSPATVNLPADKIAEKFSDMTVFADKIDNMPEDVRKRIGDLSFTRDTITMVSKQVGSIVFTVTECTDKVVRMSCTFPLRIELSLTLNPVEGQSDKTEVVTDVDINIPAMLRPIIGPQMQKVADHFGSALGHVAGL